MEPSCLALTCSPRKTGNTAILAAKVLEGCQSAGYPARLAHLTDYRYAPCRACGGCNTTGKCVVKDDAGQLFEEILACNRFVLAAPVFSMGICAQAKSFIDRSQQFWAARYLLGRRLFGETNRQQRRGVYVGCAGTRLPDVFDGTLQVVRYLFKILEIDLVATLCYPGIDGEGEIRGNATALQEAFELGRRLAGGQDV
jgi:hypothetical protein